MEELKTENCMITRLFELVDATSDEMYYPLGIFTELADAIAESKQHDPSGWDEDHDERAVAEIRARELGLSGHHYKVLWRCFWVRDEILKGDLVHRIWVHKGEPEMGTMERPLRH